MNIVLKRPIVTFDLETTGVSVVHDRIVEISMHKVMPNGDSETKTRRINPERPIPPEVTAIHGITDDDVKDCPTFKQLAKSIYAYMVGCDLVGFNVARFDLPMLSEEFLRAGVDFDASKHQVVDAQVIFHKREQRTLAAAYQFYCGKSLVDAHSAEADTIATWEVLEGQLAQYSDLSRDVEELAAYTKHNNNVDLAGRMIYNDKGVEVFNFGKHKGRAVSEVLAQELSYYDWIIKGDFALDTKRALTRIKLRSIGK